MKLTLAERIGNLFSFGAVAKYKLKAMQLESEYKFWTQQNDKLMDHNDRLIKQRDEWANKAVKRGVSLALIADMGTPSMAHIGKKMQAEALKGLGQQNTG